MHEEPAYINGVNETTPLEYEAYVMNQKLGYELGSTPRYENYIHASPPLVCGMEDAHETTNYEWQSGLCQCSNHSLGLCCCAVLCPCVLFGDINERIQSDPHGNCLDCAGRGFYSACLGFVCMNCVCIPCACLLHRLTHRRVRELYNIRPSNWGDTLDVICCQCCALMQEHEQIV